jgi:hypothetical protein
MGKLKDVHADVRALDLLPAQLVTTTGGAVTSTGVDVSKYGGRALVKLSVGSKAGTTPTLAVKLQESDVIGSGYTDVSGGAFTTVGDETKDASMALQLDPLKKFLRVVATPTGVGGEYGVYVGIFAGADHEAPVGNAAA